MIGEQVSNLDWQDSKYFIGQLSELNFLCHVSFMVENFLESYKLNFFKTKSEKKYGSEK